MALIVAAAMTISHSFADDAQIAGELASLLKEAQEGKASSQYYLALRYLHGVGMPKDEGKAVSWFERAAAGGDPGAAYNLARLLKDGKIMVADPARAVRLLRFAVEQKVPGASVELGEMLLTGSGTDRNFGEAVSLFREAATLGNSAATFNLGVMYARGWGVTQNADESMRWYERAADEGEPNAQFNVANAILAKGNPSREEAARAMKLLSQAAAQGVSAAMFTLGRIYEEGRIVPADDVSTFKWYRAAVANGHEGAMSNLARLLLRGQFGQESDKEAIKLLENAAEKLDPSALYNLGALKERGIILKRDPAAAKESYKLAADLGFGPAQFALARMLAQSKVAEDQARAVAWATLAREQDPKSVGDEFFDRLPPKAVADGRFLSETYRNEIARTRSLREGGADVATVMLNRVRPAKATVNGFLISQDGMIVAPYTPIAGASAIKVRYEGSLQPATIIGADESRDVAVLWMTRNVDHWLGRSPLEPTDADGLRAVWFHKPWLVELEAPAATSMHAVVSATPFGADREWLALNAVWDSAAVGGVLIDGKGVVGMLTPKTALGGSLPGVPNGGASEFGVAVRTPFIDGIVAHARAKWPSAPDSPLKPEDVAASLVVVLGFD